MQRLTKMFSYVLVAVFLATGRANVLAMPTITLNSAAANKATFTSLAAAVGGALDRLVSVPRHRNNIPVPGEYLTISIVNSHTAVISTMHVKAADAPSPVSGVEAENMAGTLALGSTAAIAVPTNWAGMIAVVDATYNMSNAASKIEANFVYRPEEEYQMAVANVDGSYVDGFSLALTCSCSGKVVTGCNKDLFALSRCSSNDHNGAYVNPLRADLSARSADPFFAPCQGKAYTFPHDDKAIDGVFGSCQDGISCCVGISCPAND